MPNKEAPTTQGASLPDDQNREIHALNLDWDSLEGKTHMLAMAQLGPDDPVAKAHAKNLAGTEQGERFLQLQRRHAALKEKHAAELRALTEEK